MRDQELDRLFDRFRRKGDVPALGTVFDATAPELLHVAMSLVRDPGEADDLLQETFLTAIERAARYDAERRLAPWLLGILVHHARELRRLRAREIRPERLAPSTADGTEARAHEREPPHAPEQALSRRPAGARALPELSWGVRALREEFRQGGKTAAEIARAGGLASGAVRMRVHRALERLRRLLPAGLALGGAADARGRGLADVRAVVLTAAART